MAQNYVDGTVKKYVDGTDIFNYSTEQIITTHKKL